MQANKQTQHRSIPMEEKLLNYATNWLIIIANKLCSLSLSLKHTHTQLDDHKQIAQTEKCHNGYI